MESDTEVRILDVVLNVYKTTPPERGVKNKVTTIEVEC